PRPGEGPVVRRRPGRHRPLPPAPGHVVSAPGRPFRRATQDPGTRQAIAVALRVARRAGGGGGPHGGPAVPLAAWEDPGRPVPGRPPGLALLAQITRALVLVEGIRGEREVVLAAE